MTFNASLSLAVGAMAVAALSASSSAAGTPGGPGDPVKGAKVFVEQKCNVCHRINGTGGPVGPDLSTIGRKRDAAWLAKFLPNPVTLDPKNPPKMKMLPTKAKGQELDDLIAYLVSLKVKK